MRYETEELNILTITKAVDVLLAMHQERRAVTDATTSRKVTKLITISLHSLSTSFHQQIYE
jgi:hypothetical protein